MKETSSRLMESIAGSLDYRSGVGADQVPRAREALAAMVKKCFKGVGFLERLQSELMRNLQYSPWLTWEDFAEVHSRLSDGFLTFFGPLAPRRLFDFFDEDQDSHLHEDEQLLIFTVLISKFCILQQEIIFYSLYELDQKVKDILRELVNNAILLEQKMRVRFYEEQRQLFRKQKEARSRELDGQFLRRAIVFDQFRAAKLEQFAEQKDRERSAAHERFNGRKSNFNFNKYSQFRNLIMQEKLLGLSGNYEEARNMYRNFQRILEHETALLGRKVVEGTLRAERNFEREQGLKRDILDAKLEREKEKLVIAQKTNELRHEKNSYVQENKLAKLQDELSSNSTNSFLKACVINQINSEQAMRKDFATKLTNHLRSNFQKTITHSCIQKLIAGGDWVSLTLMRSEDDLLRALERIKASHFNVRISLRNLEEKQLPVNIKFAAVENVTNKHSKIKALLKKESGLQDSSTYRLTLLYDDNLNEI